MKRQMEILQSAQSDAPGEGHLVAGTSGYTDFPDMNHNAESSPEEGALMLSPTSMSSDADKPLLQPASDSPTVPHATNPLTNGSAIPVPAEVGGDVTMPGTFTSGADLEEGEGEKMMAEANGSSPTSKASSDAAPYLVSWCLIV